MSSDSNRVRWRDVVLQSASCPSNPTVFHQPMDANALATNGSIKCADYPVHQHPLGKLKKKTVSMKLRVVSVICGLMISLKPETTVMYANYLWSGGMEVNAQ
ncbi:hypothetical protein V9T40_000640 [Parthenolecanium corni]|uniref:Uncharacterized protein n=1 Tax=Parthenolecanium corni TaxID=536013 RepID=A0AAN9TBE1_9HEMI